MHVSRPLIAGEQPIHPLPIRSHPLPFPYPFRTTHAYGSYTFPHVAQRCWMVRTSHEASCDDARATGAFSEVREGNGLGDRDQLAIQVGRVGGRYKRWCCPRCVVLGWGRFAGMRAWT